MQSVRAEEITFIMKSFATPIVWVLVLLALGLVLTRRGRHDSGEATRPRRSLRVGRLLLLAGLGLLLVLSLRPVANLLTYPLESHCQPPSAEALSGLDLVVVLGGGLHSSGGLRSEAELDKYTYPRFYRGVQVFRENHAPKLAFCGGPNREGGETEGDTMKAMALRLGLPEDQILAETQSHTTFENLANLARLLPPGQGRRIGLVTSALHMWRSYRTAAAQFPHDTIVPIPVSYTYDPAGWHLGALVPAARNFEQSTVALHEWIGLLWYTIRHR
jgi:uncharacterized SAM-binding protein YcdF (DUF218 family)